MRARYDSYYRQLALDAVLRDPDQDAASVQVVLLDESGAALTGFDSSGAAELTHFVRPSESGVVAVDSRIPFGPRDTVARVRVRAGDSFGLWSAWVEVPLEPAPVAAAGERCDPMFHGRVRCGSGLVCGRYLGTTDGVCEPAHPACGRTWYPLRWAPTSAGTFAVSGRGTNYSEGHAPCPATRFGDSETYEFVAPYAGLYRFVLSGASNGGNFGLSLRSLCESGSLEAELGCRAVGGSSGSTTIERRMSAGEHILLVPSIAARIVAYRIEVTVPAP